MPDDLKIGTVKLSIVNSAIPENTEVKTVSFAVGKSKPHPTAKGNPHGITVNQHLLPARTIERISSNGRIDILDVERKKRRFSNSSDQIFCARRCWSQDAETTLSHEIESDFQILCDKIEVNPLINLNTDEQNICNKFYALWTARGNIFSSPLPDIQLSEIQSPIDIEQIQRDELEKNGHVVLSDRTVRSYDINAIVLQHQINTLLSEEQETWHPWVFEYGECMFSIIPTFKAIPVTNKIVLLPLNQKNECEFKTTESFNRQLLKISRDTKTANVFFSHDLEKCLGVTSYIRRILSGKPTK
ncbi:hypothetical protein JK169_08965 [Acetobacter persici]|uniref:hypothetical protein n=1 Tax=Acetobacter persici TaxID=1076596 RepID=UPI001BAA488B|nr:hypothetical protein [Acetobacter persici]MBS1001138.1 hypothetical protein [Acetobacter persici]